jgi:hypothetical protein
VAVLGGVLAAGYAAAIQPALGGAPPPLAPAAGDSIGAAATIAAQQGPAGQGLLEAARSAFIQPATLQGRAVRLRPVRPTTPHG